MNQNSSDDRGAHRLKDRFREETARVVLSAAEQVFSEEGIFGASMAQIAERAGVAVGTLYNHFKDRDALLGVLLDRRSDELIELLDERLALLHKEPFEKQLRSFVGTLFDHFELHRSLLHISFSSEQVPCQRKTDTARALYERLEALLKVGYRQKIIRADAGHSFGVMLLGTVRATFLREKFGIVALDPATAVDAVIEFFLKGAGR